MTTLSLPKKNELKRESLIVALVIVSLSELQKVIPQYQEDWETKHVNAHMKYLYDLGLDTSRPYEKQNIKHRNRLNEVVTCARWVGFERQDLDWIESGYASQEAKDKFSGNKLVEDSYRMRLLTEDAQASLADRDRYTVIDESMWE